MEFDYNKYLRMDRMPTLWCWGCGDGVILKCIVRAIHNCGWDMKDVCVVSGIGCSGRMSGYINCNTVHTTHGRALAYATGIKLANPDKKVIVVCGDGDALAIGGNHTIHASRRNIDLNLVLVNNFIYGLTNSQTSPLTPRGFWTSTAQYGNIDPNFDACLLAQSAGASFVARESVTAPKKIEKILQDGFLHDGFSFMEILSNCHINLGRKNKMSTAVANLEWIDSITMPKAKYDNLESSQKVGKFPTGVLHNSEVVEYTKAYSEIIKKARGD